MNMIYNSDLYCVVEFYSEDSGKNGFEITDKAARKEVFISGPMAASFKSDVFEMMGDNSLTMEEVDEYMSRWTGLMTSPVVLH